MEEDKFVSETTESISPVIWKRHDLPGYETCRILAVDIGCRMTGVAVLVSEGLACRLGYLIECDRQWVTQSAVVTGWVGDRTIDVTAGRDISGQWHLNGQLSAEVAGCMDIDLNFSPSTNLLPIRRLDLAVGATAAVRAAWLRFPSFKLEVLDQSYTRLESRRYRYESAGGRFVADVTVDDAGVVIDYGDIWSREVTA
jgi:hypothetical protein